MPLFSGNVLCFLIELSPKKKPSKTRYIPSPQNSLYLSFEIALGILTNNFCIRILRICNDIKKKPPLTRLGHVSELQKLCCIFCTNSFLDSFHCSQSEFLISWAKPATMPPLVRNTPTLVQNVFCWFCFSSGKTAGFTKTTALTK